MSFFIRGKNNSIPGGRKNERSLKRKQHLVKKGRKVNPQESSVPKRKAHKSKDDDEEISSEEDEVFHQNGREASGDVQSEEEFPETPQEKKLRLAKKYLEEIEREERERAEARELDKDAIGQRLKEDLLEQAGKLRREVADHYAGYNTTGITRLRGKEHKLAPTCIAVSADGKFLFSASKDCGVMKWCLTEKKRIKGIAGGRKGTELTHKGHTSNINCIALSSDSKYLATGDGNGVIHIWNPETMELIQTFKKHSTAVTGLVFRRDSHQMFSCSADRSVKIWSLDEMSYVESLFGHQSGVTAIDALTRERAVTSGGRDNSLRIWKVVEESQLVYNGHKGSIDCVRLVNEEHFLSCGDDGMMCLWGAMKKKPLSVVEESHGINPDNGQPFWVCSIASLLNTDLVASGSHDGYIRLWKCGEGFRSLTPLFTIPVVGFINCLAFSPDGANLIAGVGQEHRLGRWWRIKEASNSILIIPLKAEALKLDPYTPLRSPTTTPPTSRHAAHGLLVLRCVRHRDRVTSTSEREASSPYCCCVHGVQCSVLHRESHAPLCFVCNGMKN